MMGGWLRARPGRTSPRRRKRNIRRLCNIPPCRLAHPRAMYANGSMAPHPLLALAHGGIPSWAWLAFVAGVCVMLAMDLGVFHKKEKAVSFKEALLWCGVWMALATAFGFFIGWGRGPEGAGLFASGYLLELALSVDNLFVILVVFGFFRIPEEQRHRVLFWGI